ncbi:MAG: DEAD/DEAH box helicase [Nanoarchaeota archaeon]
MDFLQNITPREYQQKIFETCKEKNCLVILPTGLGKTLIALMLVIDRMKKFPTEKIIFLAPTKPLIEQHLISFKKYLPELFADMQLFTGEIKAEQRKKIWKTADIIFSTPQCVANDLKKNHYNLNNVSLLVEDEAHRCVKNYDYNFIAQKYKSQAINQRIVGLTASPGSETKKIKEICKNLGIEKVELRTRESADVKRYIQELKFKKIHLEFPSEFEEIRHVMLKLFNRYVEELKFRNVLFGPVSKIALINLQKKIMSTIARGNKNYNYMLGASACAQAIKIQHALELLETQTLTSFNKYLKKLFNEAAQKKSKGVIKLISKPEFNFSYMQSNELLTKNQEHPKLEKLKEIIHKEKLENPNLKIIVFTQFRDTATAISKKINEIEKINAKVFVGQAKKEGIGLNQKEQKKIIQEFSSGKTNVLCATCIAEEGLDIPEVNAVIFYEPIPSAIRAIQRAGRTARLQKGKLIMLITKNTRDERHYFISRAREKGMHKAIDSVKKELQNGKLEFQRKL